MTAFVEAQGIHLRLGGRVVLEDVSLRLEAGRIVTLIGPNGAGKTSLVRVLLGLLKPTAGRVVRKPGLRVGYVPQRLAVDATLPLTALGFLRLAGADPARCRRSLARVGVDGLADRPLAALSGGELQRALLARALLRRPELLVLDEPDQGLDIPGRRALHQLLAELRDELGCAVLLVSHDLHLVMAATDLVLCLNRHLCCSGTPDAVRADPAYGALFGLPYTHRHDHVHRLSGAVARESGDG